MLATIKFILDHKEDWQTLLAKSPYSITIKEDEHYYLLKYSQEESDFNQEIVKECRGLIIDKVTLNPVALSFKKFFNVQEEYAAPIDWSACKVTEKLDGSKILLFWNEYENKWQCATSGVLNAYEADVNDLGLTYGNLFEEAILNTLKHTNIKSYEEFCTYLDPRYCYTYELVSPKAKIVVKYDETLVYLIGIRDCKTFEEYDIYDLIGKYKSDSIIKYTLRPMKYRLPSLKMCLQAVEKFGYEKEGFVVVDKFFNRIKIKSPEYVIAHHLRMNDGVSKKVILQIIEEGTQDDYLSVFPEFKEYFDDIQERYVKYKHEIITKLKDFSTYVKSSKLTRKEYAEYIFEHYADLSYFLFKYLDFLPQEKDFDSFTKTCLNNLSLDNKLKVLDNIEKGEVEVSKPKKRKKKNT